MATKFNMEAVKKEFPFLKKLQVTDDVKLKVSVIREEVLERRPYLTETCASSFYSFDLEFFHLIMKDGRVMVKAVDYDMETHVKKPDGTDEIAMFQRGTTLADALKAMGKKADDVRYVIGDIEVRSRSTECSRSMYIYKAPKDRKVSEVLAKYHEQKQKK